ncbi:MULTISPECIES: glycosyltransferase [unclassified Nonomuraea]|uniref:glycosyltransferase n=1 Tax=unclassified Nonomuraea TaxID=2593643 RepID=UPI0033D34404
MTWQRRLNEALRRYAGVRFERVSAARPDGPSDGAAETSPETPRPPADPEHDRLLTAPVFILSPVRSGSTLLRAMLDAHPLPHAPHELHVWRLSVGFGTSLARRAMEELGHNQADLEHLLWDRVLSSRFEGLPMVMIEAMGQVAAFDCPTGPGDVVTHEVDGLLVPPEDVGALAAALDRLMGDRELRLRIGKRAARTARGYAPEAVMPLWEDLFSELMAREPINDTYWTR